MATSSQYLTAAISERLVRVCTSALEDIVLAPSVQVRGIDVDVLLSSSFDSDDVRPIYIVTISTNDATMVRGAVRAYKGSYKERLEAVLDREVKHIDQGAVAHVEIIGPESQTVDRLIPIRTFSSGKRLSSSSPIVRTARENNIDYIQIRGRHFIAPSPAIATFLRDYTSHHPEIRHVADLFAGTAIATKVLLRSPQLESVVVVENDPQKIAKIRQHVRDKRVQILQADAIQFSFLDRYDLAVADPYYEDVELFLDAQLENLRRNVAVLILVPGGVEDQNWNHRVLRRLEGSKYHVAVHELYGQVLFEAKVCF